MAGMGGNNPTPWWQLPGGGRSRQNLERSAPEGYEYNPVQMQYNRTPASLGAAQNTFNNAANPSLAGLYDSIMKMMNGGGGFGSSSSSTMFGGSVGGPGGFGGDPRIPPGGGGGTGGGPGYVAQIKAPDMKEAGASAFAAEKDRAGQLSRASLDALRGELGATGLMGSGAEVQGTKDVIQQGAGIVGQANRDVAQQEADMAADFAKTGYAGAITQRGQDISREEAQARLAQERARMMFEQRQAQSSQMLQLLQLALGGLKGGGGGIPGYSY